MIRREDIVKLIYQINAREREQFVDEYNVLFRKARLWEELPDESKPFWYVFADLILAYFKAEIEQIPDPAENYTDDWLRGWRCCRKDILSKLSEELE